MDYDIIVVGAGPAGLSFARSLADSGLRIAIIEKQSRATLENPEFDGRDIALTHLSVRILKELGVWDRIGIDDRPEIRQACVMDGTSPYTLDFDLTGIDVDALGYIVSNHDIRRALYSEIDSLDSVDLLTDLTVESVATDRDSATATLSDGQSLTSRLLICADSRFSETRRMVGISADMLDFGRVCIVGRMDHDKPHDGIAYECFHYGRTLAILPLSSHQSSIVVTAPMNQRDRLMAMSKQQFAFDIEQRFERRYGAMRQATERFAYPLVGVHAKKFCAERCALVGDAAVGMHPVTAHGYNLGLAGADILAQIIRTAAARGQDIGDLKLLQRYERKHLRSTRPIYHGTNEIVKFFTDDRGPAKLARKLAMRLANNLPPIKHAIRNKLTERTNHSKFGRIIDYVIK
jgi:ubiquinone biosynthesis UbiH/UbiF/VisC/COQ6 family hydroxylase